MALGYYEFTGRNSHEAIRHFNAALDLNPNFAAAEGSIGFALALNGQSGTGNFSLRSGSTYEARDRGPSKNQGQCVAFFNRNK